MTTTLPPSGTARDERVDLAAVAPALEPVIREHAQRIEDERTLPAPVVEGLERAGVFATFLPRELGGLEVEPLAWLDMVEELSRIDASVGWTAMIGVGQGAAFMTPEQFARVTARTGGRFISSASFGRMAGTAVRVEGGYRISGRWPFASISPFATWCGALSMLHDDDGRPVLHPLDGQPWVVNALWPAAEAILHDTWDGLGLRGTGSGDMEVADLFVPTEQVDELGLRSLTYDRPLFRIRQMPLMGHAAHAIGIARAAQDAFLAQVRKRAPQGSIRQLSMGQQAHQIGYGRADALVRAARAYQDDVVARAYAHVHEHPDLSMELKVEMRSAMVFAVRACREAVDLLFQMAGSSAVGRGRPLERAQANILTAANHITCVETEYGAIGSYHLTAHLPDGPRVEGRPFF